jgi:hypothetical protein
VRAPSHTVLPSVVADIPRVRVSVIYFASPRITGASARQRPVALIAFRTGHGAE